MSQPIQGNVKVENGHYVCIYKNSKNTLSIQEIYNASLNISGNTEYVQGWSEQHSRPITLRVDRIIKTFKSYNDAEKNFDSIDESEVSNISLPSTGRLSTPETMDICFTGFTKDEKETLFEIAKKHNITIRKSVTRHLNILCFGKNAGPSKLAQASSQGVIIVTKEQFETLVETGELPDTLAEDIQLNESVPRKKTVVQDDLVSGINSHLVGLKEYPRRENLIAIFNDGHASGWKFYVPDAFKEALDIKITPMSMNSKTITTWTQGHAYSFKIGDSIYSHPHNDWKKFLLNKEGLVLSVRYANPSGFVENQKIEGLFSGSYYQSKTRNSATEIENGNISVSSYIYDAGILVVDVFKVNEKQNGVEKIDTIHISQVDFVTLLQHGYYWQKPYDSDDDTPVKKVTLIY